MTSYLANKLPVFLVTGILMGIFFHPQYAGAEEDTFFTVEVWKFETRDGAFRTFDSLVSWLPPDKRDLLRIEQIRGSFAVRVGKSDEKFQADQLLELVAERFTTASLVKTRYDRNRLVKLYRTSHESPTSHILTDVPVTTPQAPVVLPRVHETPAPAPPDITPEKTVHPPGPDNNISATKSTESVAVKKPDTPVTSPPAEIITPVSPVPVEVVTNPELPEPEQKMFTVQVGSFHDIKQAKKYYRDLEWLLTPTQRGFLRIERVKGFITVRVGSFATESEARPLLITVRERDKTAHILYTHILENRIEQLYREPNL